MEFKKCPHCGKELSIEAEFCGFCGTQLPAAKPAVKATRRSFKQISFAVLFFLYLSISYFPSTGQVITDFHERSLELKISISEFQTNFISSLTYVNDFICSIFFVGLFAYWFKGLRIWKYLFSGLAMKYWILLFLAIFLIGKGEFSAGDWPDSFLCMISIQIASVLIGAFIGAKIAANFDYLDERDKTKFFFCGLSKKFLLLMTIAYNPVLQFLNKLSVFVFYTASKTISDVANWSEFFTKGQAIGILIILSIPFVLLATSLKVFAIGIEAVKDKTAKFRRFKIAAFLIAMPLLLILIPIIRNRTWFF